MERSRRVCSRILREAGLLLPLLGFGLGGCLFGENQQFFSRIPQAGDSRSPDRPPGNPQLGDPTAPASPVVTPSPNSGVSLRTELFRIPSAGDPGIDLLFCVDNSASMADNQQILADSFQGFIRGFLSAGLDFHIGIITSDVDSTRTGVWRSRMPDYPEANVGLLLSRFPGERYLSSSSRDLVGKFVANVRVGTRGSSREQCLASFISAIERSTEAAGAWNSGFFRKDAFHAFVTVSDENEDIQNGETIENRVARLRLGLAGVSDAGSRGARFDFIVNLSATPPLATPAPGALQYYPSRYLAASNLLGGHNHDISRNFSSDLLAISDNLVRQVTREFTLGARPVDAESIRVDLDGIRLSRDSQNGYEYHDDRNSIELKGSAAGDAAGKKLEVSYRVQTR